MIALVEGDGGSQAFQFAAASPCTHGSCCQATVSITSSVFSSSPEAQAGGARLGDLLASQHSRNFSAGLRASALVPLKTPLSVASWLSSYECHPWPQPADMGDNKGLGALQGGPTRPQRRPPPPTPESIVENQCHGASSQERLSASRKRAAPLGRNAVDRADFAIVGACLSGPAAQRAELFGRSLMAVVKVAPSSLSGGNSPPTALSRTAAA